MNAMPSDARPGRQRPDDAGVHLFVYGILTRPDIVRAITGCDHGFAEATLPGYRRQGLPHPDGDVFAAIAPAAGHQVPGRLIRDVSPEHLAAFDKVEEIGTGYYVRVRVAVAVPGEPAPVPCMAYVCGPARVHTLTGDWRPADFGDAAAQAFIRDELPRLLG